MTCIIGYIDEKHKRVYMGADSCASNGFSKNSRKDKKIFKPESNDNFLVSFTSSYRMGQLLMYSDIFPTEEEIQANNLEINHKYIVSVLIPEIQDLFINNGFGDSKEGGIFLIAYKDKLFKVESDYQVCEELSDYSCGGSGEYHAYGCLYVLEKHKDIPINIKVHIALQCASHYCVGVEEPFYIMNTHDNNVMEMYS